MPAWFWFSLLTNLFWSLFSIPAKLAGRAYEPREIFVFVGIGYGLTALIMFVFGPKIQFQTTSALFGIASGICLALGMVAYLAAISTGKISVIVALTTLYPALTVILSYFIFRESITFRQAIGIALTPVIAWLITPR